MEYINNFKSDLDVVSQTLFIRKLKKLKHYQKDLIWVKITLMLNYLE